MGMRIALVVFLLMLIPVLSAALIFPAFNSQAFNSVGEIDPAQIKWLTVRLYNRAELDGGGDVGPYYASSEDYAKLLAPLESVPAVEEFVGARGPWLGEYRVMMTNGRRATIKLYWQRRPQDPPTAPVKLRFQVGDHRYEGGTAAEVTTVAVECETRGRAAR
jgi:hypothetical protein